MTGDARVQKKLEKEYDDRKPISNLNVKSRPRNIDHKMISTRAPRFHHESAIYSRRIRDSPRSCPRLNLTRLDRRCIYRYDILQKKKKKEKKEKKKITKDKMPNIVDQCVT